MSKTFYTPSPKTIEESAMTRFQKNIESKFGLQFASYSQFHSWSVANLETFWDEFSQFIEFPFLEKPTAILAKEEHFIDSKWFVDAKSNYAACILRRIFLDTKKEWIVGIKENGDREVFTGKRILDEVKTIQDFLRKNGFSKGQVVACVMPHCPETMIIALAALSLGGVFTSASPDFGTKSICDRFLQSKPRFLFSVDGYFFKGKEISILENLQTIAREVSSLESIVVVDYLQKGASPNGSKEPSVVELGKNFISFEEIRSSQKTTEDIDPSSFQFEPISFQDPVFIMYSSGTTGLPKCIVQGLGVVLNHWKEQALHCNSGDDDIAFYYTTCGWMMWNWQMSFLGLGTKLVTFDGNPFYPNESRMLELVDKEKISIFGTSAKYLSTLESFVSSNPFPLAHLKCILSTGSPLSDASFAYVYSKIKTSVQLASISGGTDLNGCFVLGNSNLEVRKGEIQCKGLGMDVQVFGENGEKLVGATGELVCKQPFPSMPLYFLGDDDKTKYKNSYFAKFPQVWCHGDFISETPEGSFAILGRSDATLNPGGVRIGTAEIYNSLESLTELEDSVCIGLEIDLDVEVVLFVKLKPGVELTEALVAKIKKTIREKTSPRHVPKWILSCPDIPYTINNKKVEIAVKESILGKPIKNLGALKNPESLEFFANTKFPK